MTQVGHAALPVSGRVHALHRVVAQGQGAIVPGAIIVIQFPPVAAGSAHVGPAHGRGVVATGSQDLHRGRQGGVQGTRGELREQGQYHVQGGGDVQVQREHLAGGKVASGAVVLTGEPFGALDGQLLVHQAGAPQLAIVPGQHGEPLLTELVHRHHAGAAQGLALLVNHVQVHVHGMLEPGPGVVVASMFEGVVLHLVDVQVT